MPVEKHPKVLPASDIIDDIDTICDEFEAAWLGGQKPRIEDYLGIPGKDSVADLLPELLTTELELRIRAGESPLPVEYLRRFRKHDELIRETFALLDVAAEPEPLDQVSRVQCDEADASEHRQVGPYQLLEKIGQGGMGEVYRAMHLRLKRIVAVKILPPQLSLTPEAVARFEREIIVSGKIEHPNLVRAYDANEDNGVPYLAMEYVDGIDLDELTALQKGPLPIAEVCAMICQAAEGLQNIHEHGLVHRDIKPSNLMLSTSGQVKILDMGLALLSDLSDQHGLTSTFRMMGTIDYMAPEQAEDTHNVDIRADIYGLGATLYKLLSGRTPLGDCDADNRVLKIVALSTREIPAIAQLRPDVPRELAKVIHRLLAKDRERRFASPDAVVAALKPFSQGADLQALYRRAFGLPPKDREWQVASPHPARNHDQIPVSAIPKWGWFLCGAVLLNTAIVAALTVFLCNRFDTDQPAIRSASGFPHRVPTVVNSEGHAASPAKLGFIASGQMFGYFDSTAVSLGDVDSDGDLDALVVNGAKDSTQIWRNNGHGRFVLDSRIVLGTESASVNLWDTDTDGDLDVIAVNGEGFLDVFLNDGTATFFHKGKLLPCHLNFCLALGDLDNDGDVDAFVGKCSERSDEPNRVLLNDGHGVFRDSGQFLGKSTSTDIALGDLDGDGDLDAFVANTRGNPDRVWFNDGHGVLHDSGQLIGAYRTSAVSLGDVDGDGDLDAVTAHTCQQPNHVWLNDGCGVFSDSGQTLGASDSSDVALGDLDLDGDLDVFVSNSNNQPNRIWLNDGTGRFFDSGIQLGNSCEAGVALGDLDGDGDLDAFVVNANREPNRAWMNTVITFK